MLDGILWLTGQPLLTGNKFGFSSPFVSLFFFGDLCPGCSGSKEPMDVNPGQ